MKKNFSVEIQGNPNGTFLYGSCAHLAISSAFDMQPKSLEIILDLMRIKDHKKGLTYYQCTKIINYLAKRFGRSVEYLPNIGISFGSYVYFNNKGTHIVMFDEHLSFVRGGIIYDNYFISYNKGKILNWIPTGFWRIK